MAEREDLGAVTVQKRGLVRLGEARRLLGIEEGDTLHMWVEDGRIILEPVDLVPRSERYLQSAEWAAALRQALDDLRAGRVRRFESADDLIADLHRGHEDQPH